MNQKGTSKPNTSS